MPGVICMRDSTTVAIVAGNGARRARQKVLTNRGIRGIRRDQERPNGVDRKGDIFDKQDINRGQAGAEGARF